MALVRAAAVTCVSTRLAAFHTLRMTAQPSFQSAVFHHQNLLKPVGTPLVISRAGIRTLPLIRSIMRIFESGFKSQKQMRQMCFPPKRFVAPAPRSSDNIGSRWHLLEGRVVWAAPKSVKYIIGGVILYLIIEHFTNHLHCKCMFARPSNVVHLVENSCCDPMKLGRWWFPWTGGCLPVHSAAFWGRLETVRYLVQKKPDTIGSKTTAGRSLLHCACRSGRLNLVKFLVNDKKADLTSRANNGRTALHVAAIKGYTPIVRFLVKKGAKMDQQDRWGMTPLHYAVLRGNMEMAAFLVDENSPRNIPDWLGLTAEDYAAPFSWVPWDRFAIKNYLNNV